MRLDGLQFRGRVAVVTGGSRGIGRAVVELLAELGSKVVVNYLHDAAAADTAVAFAREQGVEAFSNKANVARMIEAQQLIDATMERFQRIDILVCNAGVWEGAEVDSLTEEIWNKTIDTNLKGTWTICRAAVPHMKQRRTGRIVIVSSTAGQRGEANFSSYAASKGGQIAFTKSLAAELAPWGINVNAVAPGWVDTRMTQHALADSYELEAIIKTIPLGAVATPDDIAAPVAFLCSDWARYITGEILNVNGGSVLCG